MFKLFYPEETSRISNNFFVIKSFFSNVFVFTDRDHSFCIDAGYGPESLKKGLGYLNIDPQSIRSVFLTHSDFDHVGGLSLLHDARIYLNENEEQMINKRTPRFFGQVYNKKIKGNTQLLCHNERIRIGGHTIQAISTPGHTPGHTAYLVDDKYLFTGDSIIIRNGIFHPLFFIFNKNHKDATDSMNIIKNLKGIRYICTSHFGIHKMMQSNVPQAFCS